MADISKEISNIYNNKSVIEKAAYGKDVRAAISGALQALCNVLVTLNTDEHPITVKNQTLEGKQTLWIADDTSKTLVTISEDGKINIDANTEESGSIGFQTKVCKKLIDNEVNLQTIDLNTIEPLCNCIDIIVDIKDSTTSFQLSGCPYVQDYESRAFHFTRLYNVEYFRSFYDYSLWMRKDKGTWIEIAALPPSVG